MKIHELKGLWGYVSNHMWEMCLVLIVTFIGMLTELSQPWFFGKIIDLVSMKKFSGIFSILFLMIGVELISNLLTILSSFFMTKVGVNVSTNLKINFYNRMIFLSSSDWDNMESGNLLTRFENDISTLANFLSMHFVSFIMHFFGIFIALFFCARINIILTIIVVIFLPASFLIEKYFSKILKIKIYQIRNMNDEYVTLFNETIQGANDVKHLNLEEHFKIMMSQYLYSFKNALLKMNFLRDSGIFLKKNTFIILEFVMLIVGMQYISLGLISLGSFVAFTNYSARLHNSISNVIRVYGLLNEVSVNIKRIEEINNIYSTENEQRDNAQTFPKSLNGPIVFENVDFAYDNSVFIFKNLTFSFVPNKINVLIGDSGIGKSTIFKLIERFYSPIRGKITVNGNLVNDIDISTLRRKIGYAPHNPYFFHVSIKENLLYANPNASCFEIKQALQEVNLYDFVISLPDGMDTLMLESGSNFSDGQKQRLNIARLILKKPEIYLLDEPTSALDLDNKEDILKVIKRLSENNMVIMITHDSKTLNYFTCPHIVQIDNSNKRFS